MSKLTGSGGQPTLLALMQPQWLRAIGLVLSLTAAYFLTIQSIKVDLATKADHKAVAELNRKLTNIEVLLREGVLDKESFYAFTATAEKRLTTIETMLSENKGR